MTTAIPVRPKSDTHHPARQAHRLARQAEALLAQRRNAEAALDARDALQLATRWLFVSRTGRYGNTTHDVAGLVMLLRTYQIITKDEFRRLRYAVEVTHDARHRCTAEKLIAAVRRLLKLANKEATGVQPMPTRPDAVDMSPEDIANVTLYRHIPDLRYTLAETEVAA